MYGAANHTQVDDDPEYGFSDNFRGNRKSNLNRQLLLHRLSHKLNALMSLKANELGANAVLAYQQHFDMEGDSGIVARAFGTAFRYVRIVCCQARCRHSHVLKTRYLRRWP